MVAKVIHELRQGLRQRTLLCARDCKHELPLKRKLIIVVMCVWYGGRIISCELFSNRIRSLKMIVLL